MEQFIGMIKQFIWWSFITIIFVLAITYYQSIEIFTKTVLILIAIMAGLSGLLSSVNQYRLAIRQSNKEGNGEEEICLKWSPLSEMQYALMGWLTFLSIVFIGIISPSGLNANDLVQAAVALLAFSLAKKVFKLLA